MIPLCNFMNRPDWTKYAHQEIVNSLSTVERQDATQVRSFNVCYLP